MSVHVAQMKWLEQEADLKLGFLFCVTLTTT
jgi:hypothetical protein